MTFCGEVVVGKPVLGVVAEGGGVMLLLPSAGKDIGIQHSSWL